MFRKSFLFVHKSCEIIINMIIFRLDFDKIIGCFNTEKRGKTVEENIILCASSAYEEKYYLSEEFSGLPESIKEDLKIMCVLFTADIGGILTLEFDSQGDLMFKTECDEGDLLYDDIGSVLKIKQLQETKKELLESLELYYRAFFLNEDVSELLANSEE